MEGILREMLRNLQVLRKDAGYDVADRVVIDLSSNDELINEIIDSQSEFIEKETLSKLQNLENFDMEREFTIKDMKILAKIKR